MSIMIEIDCWTLTRQKISGFLPKDDGLKNALTGTDVVVIPAGIPRESSANINCRSSNHFQASRV